MEDGGKGPRERWQVRTQQHAGGEYGRPVRGAGSGHISSGRQTPPIPVRLPPV